MSWDFSRYNVIVKQVEGVADILHAAANTITPLVKSDPHGIAPQLLELLREAAADLDIQALKMLALYDPAAKHYVAQRFTRDPRRGIIDPSRPIKQEPKMLNAPHQKKNTERRGRRKS